MAADASDRRDRPSWGGSGFGGPAESARAQMILRIRTILGDPAVAARIEAALRERIRATRPDMPETLRDFLADDEGSIQFPLSLPMGLFYAHPVAPPPGSDPSMAPASATSAVPGGAASGHGCGREDVLEDLAAV
jgi:hypothetical protein